MVGVILLVIAFIVFVPVVLMSGVLGCIALGSGLVENARERHAGSELLDLDV